MRHFSCQEQRSELSNLYSVKSLFTFNDFVFYLIVFPDSKAAQSCHMDKDVFVCVVFNDKAVSLSLVEKFYSTCWHNVVNKNEIR